MGAHRVSALQLLTAAMYSPGYEEVVRPTGQRRILTAISTLALNRVTCPDSCSTKAIMVPVQCHALEASNKLYRHVEEI